jgi:hypothetical protein
MLACDLGYGSTKLFGDRGGLVMASHVATDGRAVVHSTAIRSKKPPLEITTSAGAFYVGLGAHDWGRPVESLDFDRFTGTPELRALLYGALTEYGVYSDTRLIVGLPLALLSGQADEVRDRVAAVKTFLKGAHAWSANGYAHAMTVDDVLVASQADGTLFDYLLDGEGVMTPAKKGEFKSEIGIVNIGMNTVDLLVSEKGAIKQKFTAGDTRGVRRLLQLLNTDGMYSLGELDAQLRVGSLNISDRLDTWQREITGFIDDQWGRQYRRFSRVVCAGGGSVLLRDMLIGRFGGKVHIPDDPIICTARGLFKYALMRERKK